MSTHTIYEQLSPAGHVHRRLAGLSLVPKSADGETSTWGVDPLSGITPQVGDRFRADNGQWWTITKVTSDSEPWTVEAAKQKK